MSILRKILIGIISTSVVVCCLIVASWYFPVRFPKLDTSPRVGQSMLDGSFELTINKPSNRKTLVRYIIPLESTTGRPAAGAERIVFYAPFNGEASRIKKALPQWLRRFAEEGGCTVFSLTIDTDKEPNHLINRKRYYIYPESGWAELVFAIDKHLRQQFGLQPHKLLIVGESSGGSMVQMMALHYPERIESAAWHGGSRYDELVNPIDIRMLALNSWADYALQPTLNMVKQFRDIGQTIDFYALPPIFYDNGNIETHAPAQLSYDLIYEFILQPARFSEHTRDLSPYNFTDNEYYEYPTLVSENRTRLLLLWDCRPNTENNLRLKNIIGAMAKYGYLPAFQRIDYMSDEEIAKNLYAWQKQHPNAIILMPESMQIHVTSNMIRYSVDDDWQDVIQLLKIKTGR